jgi:vacuolar-type H+-ATPase subunit I/STV1
MENTKKQNSGFKTVAISLLLLSLAGNIIFFTKHFTLKNERNSALLKMDSLLSVKLLVDKELDLAKNEIETYKGSNAALDKTINELGSKLDESKSHVEKLLRENASVSALRNKLKESQKLRDECEKVVNDYIKDNEKLTAQNNSLNKSLNALSQQVEELKTKMDRAKGLKSYDIAVINYKVTKRSNKPTIRARKVNRISATFNIGENPIAEPGFKEVFMVVYDSKNVALGTQNNKFNNSTTGKEQTYSTSKPLDYKNEEIAMTINFDTELKLAKGKYRIEIYIDGSYSGKKEFSLK